MSGGLMQLVANGAQDVYLTENPTITYWKRAYQRHTNFACESIEQTFNGSTSFGNKSTTTISRNGDLINKCYLQVKLPSVATTGMKPSDVWVDYIGHALIDCVEVQIGGQTIDKHYGDWMHLWYELACKNQDGYERMIGKCVSEDEQTLYIPLNFWFNRTPGMALPLIALQYHEVKINFNFSKLDKCLRPGAMDKKHLISNSFSADLYVDYVYIDTDERRRFAQASHEYLIEQVQQTYYDVVSGGTARVPLNFNHPCKELVWVVQPDFRVEAGEHFVYSGCTHVESESAEATDDDLVTDYDEGVVHEVHEVEKGTVSTAKLQLNNHDRFSERPGSYFNLVQPYDHHCNVPRTGVYSYSFAIEPESAQPSGTCNMSRIDTATLSLNLDSFHHDGARTSGKIRVYATNFNVLRVMGGMGGLAFAN